MIRTVLAIILLSLFSQTAMAHKCVLAGSNAAEITIYNSCKNDLASGLAGHNDTKKENYIRELELENEKLKYKILSLKQYLFDLLRLIE